MINYEAVAGNEWNKLSLKVCGPIQIKSIYHLSFLIINEFQQGYSTIINEDSVNLSGGQRQLIALTRALYQKPQVLLLDEATAAMDRRTEQFVIKLLQRLKEEMIIVFVTHRVQLARQTDYIYVIENKQISASGTHEDVIYTNQLYGEAFEDILLEKGRANL